MEYPWSCNNCGFLNMVEIESLRVEWVGKLVGRAGYNCEECHEFNALHIITPSMKSMIEKLSGMKRSHSKYGFHIKKTLHKALEVQVKNGPI